MTRGRLEAFSDGVIAIIITVMVLELKVPHGGELSALRPLVPALLSYLLSFVFLGIYWNNHHHMMHAVQHVSGGVLWANLHLLFWLSLIPFVTAWMGENHAMPWPVACYGLVLLLSAIAYTILVRALLACHGPARGGYATVERIRLRCRAQGRTPRALASGCSGQGEAPANALSHSSRQICNARTRPLFNTRQSEQRPWSSQLGRSSADPRTPRSGS